MIILKIAGIVMLALLGLAFAVLLLVLLVPVRYGASGSYHDRARGTVKVTWLLHALSLKITYDDGLDVALRVLGRRMFQGKKETGRDEADGDGGELRGEGRPGVKERRPSRPNEPVEPGTAVDFVESAVQEGRQQECEMPECQQVREVRGRQQERGMTECQQAQGRQQEHGMPECQEAQGRQQEREMSECQEAQGRQQEREMPECQQAQEVPQAQQVQQVNEMPEAQQVSELHEVQQIRQTQKPAAKDRQSQGSSEAQGGRRDFEGESMAGSGKKRKTGKRGKLGKKRKPGKKRTPGATRKPRFRQMKESAESAWSRMEECKEKAVSFWKDERNKKTVKLILRQLKAVLRHVLPRRIRGRVIFGFEDPSATGNVLAALSLAYGWYGDGLEIVPVFDRNILEAEGSLKGRVQMGVIAARGVRVLLDKNFRRLARGLLKSGGKWT